MKTFVDQIIESLKTEPEKWYQSDYTIDHMSLDISLWTMHGMWYLNSWHTHKYEFNIFEKIRIWRAIKRWQKLPVSLEKR